MLALRVAFLMGLKTVGAAVISIDERVSRGECVDIAAVGSDVLFPEDSRVGQIPSAAVSAAEADVTAAGLMSISYGQSFKVVTETLAKEQYVLTQCGMNPPTTQEVDAVAPLASGYQRKYFTIPLQRVIPDTTIALAFLRRLGVEDRVTHVSQWATGPCWQKMASCGAIVETSWGNASIRAQQQAGVDAVFMDCSGDCAALRAMPNAVHFPATKDNGNLHTAEYIKFLAAFFNLEKSASQEFSATVAAYTTNAGQANGPKVAFIQWNRWITPMAYEVSLASFKTQLVAAAGGQNVDGTALEAVGMEASDAVSGNAMAGKTYRLYANDTTKEEMANKLMSALGDVDIVVDETSSFDTFSKFLAGFFLNATSDLKFVKDQKVLKVDGTLSESGGYDWFESRLAHPDWAADGLARYVNNDMSKQRRYFRNVAIAEQPEVVNASACTDALPACEASATEDAIPSPRAPASDVSGACGFAVFAAIPCLTFWHLF